MPTDTPTQPTPEPAPSLRRRRPGWALRDALTPPASGKQF